jgi:hypothetical protein
MSDTLLVDSTSIDITDKRLVLYKDPFKPGNTTGFTETVHSLTNTSSKPFMSCPVRRKCMKATLEISC